MLNKFIKAVREVEESSIDEAEWLSNDLELVSKVVQLANKVLITNDGKPNFRAIKCCAERKINTSRGDFDSFGWLTGVIHTSKGKILFG